MIIQGYTLSNYLVLRSNPAEFTRAMQAAAQYWGLALQDHTDTKLFKEAMEKALAPFGDIEMLFMDHDQDEVEEPAPYQPVLLAFRIRNQPSLIAVH